jgi:hypothetical protein
MKNCLEIVKRFRTKPQACDWIMAMEVAQKSGKLQSAMKGTAL